MSGTTFGVIEHQLAPLSCSDDPENQATLDQQLATNTFRTMLRPPDQKLGRRPSSVAADKHCSNHLLTCGLIRKRAASNEAFTKVVKPRLSSGTCVERRRAPKGLISTNSSWQEQMVRHVHMIWASYHCKPLYCVFV